MSITSIVPESQTEMVKNAVKSPLTCTRATLLAAQSLLRASPKLPLDIDVKSLRSGSKIIRNSAAVPNGLKAPRLPKIDTTVSPVSEGCVARLSTQEKLVFATEIFNLSLKVLSGELKMPGSNRFTADGMPKTPLTPASANQKRLLEGRTTSLQHIQPTASEQGGIIAIAECACLALSSLRTLKGSQVEEDEPPNLQLEQGACILSGRLIALGLNDMAYRELRSLKRRIVQYLDKVSDAKTAARTASQDKEPVKGRVLDLLTFSNFANAGPLYNLLILFQINVMRLIASERKVSAVRKVCDVLQISNPSSPVNVILLAVESGNLPGDKAAFQLQLISSTLLSLSSGAHYLCENYTPESKEQLKPVAALTLQLLSLEVKFIGWRLCGHECGEGKEFWDPLARYIGGFAHHNIGLEKSEFLSVYSTINRVKLIVDEMKKSKTSSDTSTIARVTTILGQLAQEAGCFEQCQKLFTEALVLLSNRQPLTLARVRCQLARAHFQSLRLSGERFRPEISGIISEVSTALGLPLKGNPSEFNELLVEAAKLRKFAMAWLGMIVSKPEGESREVDDIHDRIREYLHIFLRLLRRYIKWQAPKGAKGHEPLQEKGYIPGSIVLAAVDSAVAMGKVSITSQRPTWEDMQPILTDCQHLLSAIECIPNSPDSSNACSIGLGFVNLSNLFWSRYIRERELKKGYEELIPLLKRSIDLLSTCSPAQRNAGYAAIKFERLAHLYLEREMTVESMNAFCQSIREYICSGALQNVVRNPSGSPPHRLHMEPKDSGFMLGRALSTLLKIKLRKQSGPADYFDDELLDIEDRGAILEWQMGLLSELHGNAYSKEHFRGLFSLLLSNTLDIYSAKTYPLRRRRAMIYAIRFSLEHPALLEPELIQGIIEGSGDDLTAEQDIGRDSILSSFAIFIRSSLQLAVGLYQGLMQPDHLSQIIISWSSVASSSPDLDSLRSRAFDLEYWTLQIKAVIDFTEIHGIWETQLSALRLLLRVTELQEFADFSDATIILSRLVSQYCRLGYCEKAANLLARADEYLKKKEVSCLATLSYRLARAEYLLETGEIEETACILMSARMLYEDNQKNLNPGSIPILSKISWERLVADAALIHSRLSFAKRSMAQALLFAKLSVRLNCRLWAKVEKVSQKRLNKGILVNGSPDINTVVEYMSKLDISRASSDLFATYPQGAPFWPHISSHHTALLHLSNLSAYQGLFQDAVYYGEQALKINKALNAKARLIASEAQLGAQWVSGGHISKGQELLMAAREASEQLEDSIEIASLQISLASLYKTQNRYEDEAAALLEADKIISNIIKSGDIHSILSMADTEAKTDKPRPYGTRRTKQQPAAAVRRTRAVKASSKAVSTETITKPGLVAESKSLIQIRGDIFMRQASCWRAMQNFKHATNLLNDARKFAISEGSQISLSIRESEHLLADAIRYFARHAVYCVLPESTISLPALQSPKRMTGSSSGTISRPSNARRQRALSRSQSKVSKESEDFSVMLSKAGDCLSGVFDAVTAHGSTLESHAASRLMSRISVLTHTTTPGCSVTWSPPATVNEIGRVRAFIRERRAIDIDKQLIRLSDPLAWPNSLASTIELDDTACVDFTKQYVDIFPESWNVLSLSLSTDRTEFVISRLHKNQSPFLLRLPLRRGNSAEDEEQFTFDDGRAEMQEIIRLANESAHAAQAQTEKHSKREWWRNREALDKRLESLLQNIEDIWFGGFKGIFSPVRCDAVLLSRFAKSFQSILDSHLPSRRKGSRSTPSKLVLHQNVLELFTGIKDLEERDSPEDALMDLLYFVVDILQFQGERNAYDEIDFDMMVIDTLDALKRYHNAADRADRRPRHTVLVLDKSLHLFPWEAMPSLQGYPVCRVPSLECLRQRVQEVGTERGDHAISIDHCDGTYILNPTGDLKRTQNNFEMDLSLLSGWTGIIGREPSENELKHALESRKLFLYFGHGSGAQYIRGRTIRRLERCAVAFLMGCSSGALTEAGEYEPYGTPMNYLQAGSPALVATLWDVTDKDIDRFARSVFEQWGLFERGDSLSLDEAVSKSRSACVLKYLNGAAPVIYGVPEVFLDRRGNMRRLD